MERRLGSLAALTASVEPRALLWDKIRTDVAAIELQRVTTATTNAEAGPKKPDELGSEEAGPDATDPDAIAPTTSASTAVIPFDTTPSAEIVILSQRLRRTRTLAAAIGAIAALLLAFVGVRDFKPEFLPPSCGLRRRRKSSRSGDAAKGRRRAGVHACGPIRTSVAFRCAGSEPSRNRTRATSSGWCRAPIPRRVHSA